MKYTILMLLVAATLFLCMSCSSSAPHTIQGPNTYEIKDSTYIVRLKNGKAYTTRKIRISNDSASFDSLSVKLSDINTIETKAFSPGKTLALAAGIFVVVNYVIIPLFAVYLLSSSIGKAI